jgi:hypothetical protein
MTTAIWVYSLHSPLPMQPIGITITGIGGVTDDPQSKILPTAPTNIKRHNNNYV